MSARVVLFDLGGVLLPFDPERRVRVVAEALCVDPATARRTLRPDLFEQTDLGRADERDFAAVFSGVAGREVGAAEARALLLSVFGAPNLQLWGTAEALRANALVGVFSDNPRFVETIFPPGAALDRLFFSSELGATKPSPEAFQAVEERLDAPPSSILFIDDGPANVEEARRRGWDAFLFISNGQVTGELAARGFA